LEQTIAKSQDADDDVRKRLLEKPRFELAAKGVSDWEDVTSSIAGRSRSSGQQLGKHGY